MEAVLPLTEEDWVEVLRSLAAKEGESSLELASDDGGGCYLRSARKDAVAWVSRAAARHAFSSLTAVLAVNYLDRCFLSRAAGGRLRLQDDKPWMGRLAAVACLSLAAKVEETRVPLLLDLQAEQGEYVFEPRTIRRMELLVLAALRWRMNPVTPLSFIHHLLLRLRSKDKNAKTDPSATAGIAMARRCEAALLYAIAGERTTSKCVFFIPFRHHFLNSLFIWRRLEMGSVSFIDLGSGGTDPSVRGGGSREPLPHLPPQRPNGKSGRMPSANSGISERRHYWPQAQAFVFRFPLLFIAAQPQWGGRLLLRQRELNRVRGDAAAISRGTSLSRSRSMAVREEGVDSVRVQVSSVPSISAIALSSREQF